MPRQAMTAEQILDAADAVARRDGIDGLTIRRLCAELGVTAPTVYTHFRKKDELVERLVETILARVHRPSSECGDWVDRLREFMISVYDQVVPYRGLAARIAHELPTNSSSQRNIAFLLELTADSGVGEDAFLNVTSVLFLYTWGHLIGSESSWQIGTWGHVIRSKSSGKIARTAPLSSDAARDRYLWGLEHLLDSMRKELSATSTKPSKASASGSRRTTGRGRPSPPPRRTAASST